LFSSGSRVSNFNGNFTALYLAPKRIDDWKPRKEGFPEISRKRVERNLGDAVLIELSLHL